MATDWNTPSLSQLWANFLAAIKGRDESAAKMDFTGDTNLPSGVVRYNRTSSRFEEWNGTAWTALTPDLTSTTGVLPTGQFNDAAHGNRSGGTLHSSATGGAAGFMASTDKTKLDGATSLAIVNTLMMRDAAGRSTVAVPSAGDDIARKDTVDNHAATTTGVHGVGVSTVESASGAQAKVDAHAVATGAGTHGATAAASANSIMFRDANGRSKAAAPAVSDDIARKLEVDAVQSYANGVQNSLSSHVGSSGAGIHGSTSAATASSIVARDASGRFQAVSPSVAADVAIKSYADALLSSANFVGTGQLKTATGSATGVFGESLAVTMHDYSFSPSITAAVGSAPFMPLHAVPVNDPGNTVARFFLMGTNGYAQNGVPTVRWRYMTASDDPHLYVVIDPDTGEALASWAADDPVRVMEDVFEVDPSTGLLVRRRIVRLLTDPPIAIAEKQTVPVPLATLTQIAIPQGMLDAADRYIEQEKLKPEHRVYRALQFHARDAAPAKWLMDNCCWDRPGGVIREMSMHEKAAKRSTRAIPTTRL